MTSADMIMDYAGRHSYMTVNDIAAEFGIKLSTARHENVYRQPDAKFMSDYVDLRLDCIIVKPLVTESPTNIVDGITVPTLEKLLVDILKDPDFDYLHGAEYDYMFENAVSQYSISTTRLLRYARRRGLQDTIQNKISNSVL